MIADQHRLADREVFAHRAGGIGEHHDAGAGGARGAHRVDDVAQVMSLVGVHATGQHQHAVLADADRQQLAGVTDRRRRSESGHLGHRQDRGRPAQRGDGRCPARPQHDRHVVFGDPEHRR